jgi:oligopeptide transport system ATP-binding protein
MSAVPIPDPDLEKNKTIQLLEGELPSPINPPSGCVFRTRCPMAGPECAKTRRCWKAVSDMRFPA